MHIVLYFTVMCCMVVLCDENDDLGLQPEYH